MENQSECSTNNTEKGNPFQYRPSSSRATSAAAASMEKALTDLDNEQHMPENVEIETWQHLVTLRRKKVEKEQQVINNFQLNNLKNLITSLMESFSTATSLLVTLILVQGESKDIYEIAMRIHDICRKIEEQTWGREGKGIAKFEWTEDGVNFERVYFLNIGFG